METLLKQLRELPARLAALPAGLRYAMIGGALLAVIVAVVVGSAAKGGDYQYVFTNLSPEDATEASGALSNASIPYRSEANGSALAVPADKVYAARVLLASQGLPRAAGIGFELFDKGDLGVSEFTQKVNLRRAIEGELARTISKFEGVKSAKVTMSLAEKGLYRDEDKKASAAVSVTMQTGRTLGERELAGIRHLVSSATPGLAPDQVTIIDGRGGLLSSESAWDSPEASYQRKQERDLEQKVVAMLEPIVGNGAVIARVSATLDLSHVNQNSEVVDPDSIVLKAETTSNGSSSNQSNQPAMVTGAVANVPLAPQQPQNGPTQQGNSSQNSATKTWEFNKTTTQTVARIPRLTKISVAVVVDGTKEGKARSNEEVARLSELARKAVGFDELRGDQFELTSQPFGKSAEVPEAPVVAAVMPVWQQVAIGAGILAGLIVAFVIFRRATKKTPAEQLVLQPGATVAALEAKQNAIDGVTVEAAKAEQPLLVDPLQDLKEKARGLLREDPERALMLVRAWLSADLEKQVENNSHGQ